MCKTETCTVLRGRIDFNYWTPATVSSKALNRFLPSSLSQEGRRKSFQLSTFTGFWKRVAVETFPWIHSSSIWTGLYGAVWITSPNLGEHFWSSQRTVQRQDLTSQNITMLGWNTLGTIATVLQLLSCVLGLKSNRWIESKPPFSCLTGPRTRAQLFQQPGKAVCVSAGFTCAHCHKYTSEQNMHVYTTPNYSAPSHQI